MPGEGVSPIGAGIGDDETLGHGMERILHGIDISKLACHNLTGCHGMDIGADQLHGQGLIHFEDIDYLEDNVAGSILFARTCK